MRFPRCIAANLSTPRGDAQPLCAAAVPGVLLALALGAVAPVQASPATDNAPDAKAEQPNESEQGRFVLSPDGYEIMDVRYRLIWRRCVEGMRWTGKTCWGIPLRLDHNEAMERAKTEGHADHLPWRVPHAPELQRLIDKAQSPSLVDPALFPSTPSQWHWSASVTVSMQSVNQYNYGSVAQGGLRGGHNQVAFLHGWAVNFATGETRGNVLKKTPMVVRLVRPAP